MEQSSNNINLGTMSLADNMHLMTGDNQNLLHAEVSSGQNFDAGVASSSFGQGTSKNDEFAPVADNDTHPSLGEEDAYSESELPPDAQPARGNRGNKRKHYQRHTQEQIQGMEAFFKQCPHPDEKQRKELGLQLGLDPFQVKFWFQNKRTQIKTQHERQESSQLRAENERLRIENKELRECIPVTACKKCGNVCSVGVPMDEIQLKSENKILKEKIEQVKAIAIQIFGYVPSSFLNQDSVESGGQQAGNIPSRGSQPCGVLKGLSELDRSLAIELSNSATDEVIIMARIGEPFWIPNFECNTIVLNEQEYLKTFQRAFAPKRVGFKSEASRECAVVMMNPQNIIEIFMELNKWLAVFSGIVSKAMLLELIPTTAEGVYNGSLQVIAAEFQVLSPAIPTRDCVFMRHCKQLYEGTWAIVDVSVDWILPKSSMSRCQKRPSGCIIQALPNGCSQITWVEHAEVQDQIIHSISTSFINSGEAYSAKRWISILRRQCERLASAVGKANFPYFEDRTELVLVHPEGKQNLLKLAERMVLSFCGSVTATSGPYQWSVVSGNGVEDVKIMTRKSLNDPGKPGGLVLSASICFWIPVLPKIIFDYLRNDKTRAEWDVLCIAGVKEIAYIGNGQEPGNCVSILRVNGQHSDQGNMLIIQESSCESTTSFIVYSPVDVFYADMLFTGGNPENIQLLPSGFTILPSGPPRVNDDTNTAGSLLTIAFQILVDSDPSAKLSIASIATVNNLIESTMEKIKIGLAPYYS